MKKENQLSSSELSLSVIEGMIEKKASNIVLMDLKKVHNAISDYFVICSGNSDTQIDAISKSIEEVVYKKSGQDPWNREGRQNREWILLDYVDVVVHVFQKDKREYYDIEALWGDADFTYFGEDAKPSKTPIEN
ncbi:ribosome silencing factor [Jiulongibacter sp. NS-SX5]|uniref:ribosome silencing factor n=1 Tax=Jiulongibacter sp. NS-SX5 TaxID=3463854 RepID=UPI0040595979